MRVVLVIAFCVFIHHSFAQESDFDKGLIAFDAKNFKKAVKILEPYAQQGDCLAQFALGFSYMYEPDIKSDSLARHWLELSAEQKQPKAMGPLSVNYFSAGKEELMVRAYMWAMLGAEYDERQKFTTTRLLIKRYLKPEELEKAMKLIDDYKGRWASTPICSHKN